MNLHLTINKRIFNDKFYPLLFDYSHRYLILYGGAGSGKTSFVAQRMVIKALQSKRKMLFVRKVAATLKDSVYAIIIQTLEQFQILHLCSINKSTFTITLPNGSEILLKGIDDSEKVKSITGITDIWIEEATELNYDDFLQLDLRLRVLVLSQSVPVLTELPVRR